MAKANPVLDFEIEQSAVAYVGQELQRPECILAEADGTLWVADARGGVVRIASNGNQSVIVPKTSSYSQQEGIEGSRFLEGTLPNGLAFDRNGNILISNFGTDCLEVMTRDGRSKVLADTIDGEAIGKVNFVLRDSKERIWITVSTRTKNWMSALRKDLPDGYIARYSDGEFHIVSDGFRFTNEIRFDAREQFLYVVETTGGCISRLRVDEGGGLRDREIFGPTTLGKGAWPDGIAFDSYGNLWGTMVYSDKLFVLTPEGDLRILLDEGDPQKVDALEKAIESNTVTHEVLFSTGQGIAPWMASVTFGGRDLQTLYIGSLKGKRIPYFRAPVAGLPMVHWKESEGRSQPTSIPAAPSR
ncbi:MAG: SMP-30/gluconolactonase/LRE family protein [Acidobacteria bacterium]|nr:SMP-30/gluconolactonase/LRE family protein [Acidobacteriota bacterium]